MLKIATLFAVVALMLACTVTTWARDIKKAYRVNPGTSYFEIELGEGESISKIKVNKKGLKLKVTKTYSDTKITDAKTNAEYNKGKKKENQARARRLVEIRTSSTKAGKFKVTFNIKKGKKTVKKKQKITVYVEDSPISSVKFAGKTYKTLGKYQGSKYYDPFSSYSYFVTKKSSGKFSAKANYGYKIVAVTNYKYDKDGEWTEVPYKKTSIKLYKDKDDVGSYDNTSYNGTKTSYRYADNTSVASFRVYVADTLHPENNYETSKFVKGKYYDYLVFRFYKYV